MQLRYLVLDNFPIIGEIMYKDNKNVVSYDVYRGFSGTGLKSNPVKCRIIIVNNNSRDWYDEIRQES